MTLAMPWSLLGLLAVAGVALWALFRPGRRLAVVPSLRLWRQAIDSLDASARKPRRRLTACWLLLLAGAVAAVLAAAGPTYHSRQPVSHVAIMLYPSVELAGDVRSPVFAKPAGGLLDRLGPHDKVQIVLPTLLGGATAWLTSDEARKRVAEVMPLPVPAGELSLPPPAPEAAHAYIFAPAGAGIEGGPKVSVVELPTQRPRVTIEAAGAALLPDGRVKILVAVRNNTDRPMRLRVPCMMIRGKNDADRVHVSSEFTVASGGRGQAVEIVEDSPALSASVIDEKGSPACDPVHLARRKIEVRKVALLGGDEPLLRKFISVHPGLSLTGNIQAADFVIANAADPPSDKPALVIDPPTSPAGWRRGGALQAVNLDDAVLAADPVMASVSLAGLAVRTVRPWARLDFPTGQSMAQDPRGSFVIKSGGADGQPRRVYVAFDLAEANTNFGTLPDFVTFAANVIRYLAPGGPSSTIFAYRTPLQAGTHRLGEPVGQVGRQADGPLPWPGLYRDSAGEFHAISLVGAASRPPARPQASLESLPIPRPQYTTAGTALWPAMAAAAGVLWLLGWAARGGLAPHPPAGAGSAPDA